MIIARKKINFNKKISFVLNYTMPLRYFFFLKKTEKFSKMYLARKVYFSQNMIIFIFL